MTRFIDGPKTIKTAYSKGDVAQLMVLRWDNGRGYPTSQLRPVKVESIVEDRPGWLYVRDLRVGEVHLCRAIDLITE